MARFRVARAVRVTVETSLRQRLSHLVRHRLPHHQVVGPANGAEILLRTDELREQEGDHEHQTRNAREPDQGLPNGAAGSVAPAASIQPAMPGGWGSVRASSRAAGLIFRQVFRMIAVNFSAG